MLTSENYFSTENNKKYMGVSQFKEFAGCTGNRGCEAKAHSTLNEMWKTEKSTALLVGSYVDSHFEGTLDTFKAQNSDIFTKSGSLKAEYQRANYIIDRIERDPYFMMYMSGKKQVIMTAELFGVPWKIKIDSYIENKAIVDLKVMASLTKTEWVKDLGKISFIEYWGYDIQAAVYQEVVRLNTGKRLPFYFAAVSKEPEPDIEIIGIDQKTLDNALERVRIGLPRVMMVKNGEVEPDRCGNCDYCKFTKILTKPVHFSELMEVE